MYNKSLLDVASFLKAIGCLSREMIFTKPISPNRIIKQRKRTKSIQLQPVVQKNKITRYLLKQQQP